MSSLEVGYWVEFFDKLPEITDFGLLQQSQTRARFWSFDVGHWQCKNWIFTIDMLKKGWGTFESWTFQSTPSVQYFPVLNFSVQDLWVLNFSVQDSTVSWENELFSPRLFSTELFSPRLFSTELFSPRPFSPELFSPRLYSPVGKWTFQSQTFQSWTLQSQTFQSWTLQSKIFQSWTLQSQSNWKIIFSVPDLTVQLENVLFSPRTYSPIEKWTFQSKTLQSNWKMDFSVPEFWVQHQNDKKNWALLFFW